MDWGTFSDTVEAFLNRIRGHVSFNPPCRAGIRIRTDDIRRTLGFLCGRRPSCNNVEGTLPDAMVGNILAADTQDDVTGLSLAEVFRSFPPAVLRNIHRQRRAPARSPRTRP